MPQWEELLVFNENLTHIVTASTLLLFEIVDFVNFALGSSRYRSLGSEGGWIKIAWAFLKLIAANGASNLDRKVRLQLFYPKNKKRKDAAPNSPLVSHYSICFSFLFLFKVLYLVSKTHVILMIVWLWGLSECTVCVLESVLYFFFYIYK